MSKLTAGQVHKALVDSIEKRWIPMSNGAGLFDVPSCQLCDIVKENCKLCPLAMIGNQCVERDSVLNILYNHEKSSWGQYLFAQTKKEQKEAAQNMINQLQKCLDTFFPAGLAKK